MLFNDECLIIEDIDQNWDKVTKPTTSKNGKMRRRSFLHCKRCNQLFRCDRNDEINNRETLHFCAKKRQLSLMDVAKPSIEHAHYNFVASCHLSMSQATSDSLYNFYKESFRSGCSAFINSNPSIKRNYVLPKAEDFYKPIQRTQFSANFNSYAKEIEEKCILKFFDLKYCSLALDAGRVNSIPMLNICLINPFNTNGSFLYKIVYYFGGCSNDYINEINIILEELQEKNITVTCFLGDNLRAQLCALKSEEKDSIQKTSKDPHIRTIEWMSCACHTTALAFTDTVNSIEILANFQEKLNKVTNFFRTKTVTSIIQIVCPSFCPTRWTNFTDITMFFINKNDIIYNFLINHYSLVQKYLATNNIKNISIETFIYQDIPALYWLLIPYKCFVNTIEADSFPVAYLFPVFENFISTLNQTAQKASELGNEAAVTYADSLISSIKYRFEDIYTHKFLKMIWFLTPAGRIHARSEYGKGSSLYSDDAVLKYCDIPQIVIDKVKIQNDIKDFIAKANERIEAVKIVKLKQNTNCKYNDIDFTDVEKESIEFDQADIGLPNYEIYNSTLEDIENLLFEKAAKLITTFDNIQKARICKECGDINNYPEYILGEYRKWILNGIKSPSIVNIYKDNPWSFWNDYAHLVPEKQVFATFCLRYLAICASSACCERSFHDINQDFLPDRIRTSAELLRHKINIRKHNNLLTSF